VKAIAGGFMNEWVAKTIGDICDLGNGKVQTGPFGSQLHQSDYQAEGYPFVMPKDILNGKIDESSIARVSINHVERLSKHKLSLGDIIYGRRGDIGRQALVRRENVGWLCGSGCLRISLGNAPIDPKFLHFYLKLPEVMSWVENQAIGATMPNLNTKILRSVPVLYPINIHHQQKIVATVSAYDDLIENNDRRIALLEKMAEEIYREWFVRLRFPGHEHVTFHKGIPEGWEVIRLETLCKEIRNGVKIKSLDSNTKYLGLEHLPRKSILIKNFDAIDSVQSDKLLFKERDILFGKIRPYLHKVVLANFAGACSSDTIVIRSEKNEYGGFLLFTIFSDTFIELATTSSKGTKMPRANWDFLKRLEIILPNQKILELYQEKFDAYFSLMCKISNSNEILKQTRDRLLTRLISGKLSVEDLDIQFPSSMIETVEATHDG
jgi:type I restriction enzyme S subunit